MVGSLATEYLHIFHWAWGSGWDPVAGRRLRCGSSQYAFCKLTVPGIEPKDVFRRETAHFYFSTQSFSSRTELYNPHLYLIFRIAAVIIFLRRHIIFVTQLISVLQLIKHFTLLHLSRNVSTVSADLRAAQCRGSIIMHLVLTAFLQYWHLQGEKEKWKGVKKQFIFLMFSVYMWSRH